MKKMIALLLAMVMVLSLFAGCGKKDEVEATDPVVTDPVVEETDPVVEETDPVVEETDPVVEESQPDGERTALSIFEKIWAVTDDSQKFPAMGGDSMNPVDGAPGVIDHTNVDELNYLYLIPAEQAAVIDDAAGMVHGMMLNNFRGGVFHLTEGHQKFVDTMYEVIKNNQWMCGFPDSLIIASIGDSHVLVAVGIDDIMDPLAENIKEAHDDALILRHEAIA